MVAPLGDSMREIRLTCRDFAPTSLGEIGKADIHMLHRNSPVSARSGRNQNNKKTPPKRGVVEGPREVMRLYFDTACSRYRLGQGLLKRWC